MATDGHSLHTSVPVFVARVDTQRGELVRIYEYCRDPDVANLTFQVCLCTQIYTLCYPVSLCSCVVAVGGGSLHVYQA